jgi:RNA polymerase sigma factor (sigma-70 family)
LNLFLSPTVYKDVADGATEVLADGCAPDALDRLVEEEYANALGFALSMTRDRDRAADIVQEAFARLISRWREVREPRAYLFQVIANLARTEWHRAGRPDPVLLVAEEVRDAVETRLVVREAVWELPPAQRNVIWLRYFVGLPLAEIARVLDHPEGSVKSLHHYAKRRLARLLTRGGHG